MPARFRNLRAPAVMAGDCSGGATVVLAAANRHVDAGAVSGSDQPGEYVAISLSDTGEGIRPDILPRVFEPFFTSKEIGRGTGLGLTQVYGFARQAGGMAKIDSRLDAGTVVTIFLPR